MLDLGTIIAGRYCLEQQIAKGGMASIWRAVQMDLDRPVAIKFLDAGRLGSDEPEARLVNEARVAASVRHRNVVDILEVGRTDDGFAYMVMELLEGESLGRRIDRPPPMSVRSVIDIVAGVLGGLAAVHDAGIVHRDMKPDNIFLVEDADGIFPKLLDFGISRPHAEGAALLHPTRPTLEGSLVGTPWYMAPEQVRGRTDIDVRVDTYSVGVILYEALTGELPFDSEDLSELLHLIANAVPPPLSALRPDLGQPLSDFLERAMAREREQRFQTAREMREALRQIGRDASGAAEWKRASVIPSRRRLSTGRGVPDVVVPPAAPLPGDLLPGSAHPTEDARDGPPTLREATGLPRPGGGRRRAVWIAAAVLGLVAVVVAAVVVFDSPQDTYQAHPLDEAPGAEAAEPPTPFEPTAAASGLDQGSPVAPEPAAEPAEEGPEIADDTVPTSEPTGDEDGAGESAPATGPRRHGAASRTSRPEKRPGGIRRVITQPDF